MSLDYHLYDRDVEDDDPEAFLSQHLECEHVANLELVKTLIRYYPTVDIP